MPNVLIVASWADAVPPTPVMRKFTGKASSFSPSSTALALDMMLKKAPLSSQKRVSRPFTLRGTLARLPSMVTGRFAIIPTLQPSAQAGNPMADSAADTRATVIRTKLEGCSFIQGSGTVVARLL